ncbi:MAG: methyltransferase [Chitinophagales bacterium]
MSIKEFIHSDDFKNLKLQITKPLPVAKQENFFYYSKHMHPDLAVNALLRDEQVLVRDFYSSALLVLNSLHKRINKKKKLANFKEERAQRNSFQKASQNLIVEIKNHQLILRKAPIIGWWSILYPEIENFHLPFVQVQGLNSAWQWFEKGLSVPNLKEKIHPFYGCYFPTRFEHLDLFYAWLKTYSGAKEKAFDLGVGSGVLSLFLLQEGFKKLYASDINANAIIGFKFHLSQKKQAIPCELFCADLFGPCTELQDLIVFNPPWLPSTKSISNLDRAIYYKEDLFPRFFEQAASRLNPDASLVILFSNLAESTELSDSHPIRDELAKNDRFALHFSERKKVNASSKNTKRKTSARKDEFVEIWVLKKKEAIS